jgi:hypothetical protein
MARAWYPPSSSVSSAGWSFNTRPFWPLEFRKETQSSALHVLMVLSADWPLHMITGTRTPARRSSSSAISPHHCTYWSLAPYSSFSTCTSTTGPPDCGKWWLSLDTTVRNQAREAFSQGSLYSRKRSPGVKPSQVGNPP